MAKCPFAIWHPISGSSGPHLAGPYKIVHHTTEGSTAQGAMSAFAKNRSDPHFTVDANGIFQHIDTAEGGRALRNTRGGVQTNRDSAVQIELVGFAHLPKDRNALTHLARLCRWIEATHNVPRVWPAGPPHQAKNGRDPGGHNRDAQTWDNQGGHFGHCHVPENTHWDPAYSAEEVGFIMNASFDADGLLSTPALSAAPAPRMKGTKGVKGAKSRGHAQPVKELQSTMPDHDVVPTGFSAYLRDLRLPAVQAPQFVVEKPQARKATAAAARGQSRKKGDTAAVNVGSVTSFVDGVTVQEKTDVLYSVQLAQRGASGQYDRFTETRLWYQKYVEILENLGWALDQFSFNRFEQREGEFRMDQAVLAIIADIATQNQLGALKSAMTALSKLAEDDGTISLFDFHSSMEESGNFQLGSVQRNKENGALTMALGAFYFRAVDSRKRFLFFRWGSQEVNLWTAAQRMTLNTEFYARRRADVIARLEAEFPSYIADLRLG